jgi:polyisoprenoid-binding protein YceI
MLDAHGFFGAWDADVRLDSAALERSTVRLTIDAASITTRNERRDGHLKSPDFFDVAKYPTITFVSRSVARTSPTTGVITGDLTMHGVTRPVQVPVTVRFYENGRGRFAGAFSVNRADYGVAYNSRMNPIENEVAVQFNMTLAAAQPAAGAGR